MEFITYLWNVLFYQPMLNLLVFVASLVGGNFGIAVILFTIVVRLVMLPLFIQQTKSSKAQQRLQPLLNEASKKYGRTSREYQQEVQRIYAENKVNPLSGCVTSLAQFPIWIGLYNAISTALGEQPDQLLNLTPYLYNVPRILQAVPFDSRFLWLNLAVPDQFFILPVLVTATSWLQTKMMPMPTDPQAQSMAQTMQIMPLMFGFFTLQVPAGLALYWLVSNTVGIVTQYYTNKMFGNPTLVPDPAAGTVIESKPKAATTVPASANGNGIANDAAVTNDTAPVATSNSNTTRKVQVSPRRAARPRRRTS